MGKRSADGGAEVARATWKKSKGRMEAIATTDAEQHARTKPEKITHVGQREPTRGGYSRSHKRRCATHRRFVMNTDRGERSSTTDRVCKALRQLDHLDLTD
jgi:hypothetical protein